MSDHDPPRPEAPARSTGDAADERALAAIYHGGEPDLPPAALDERIAAAAATASAHRARRRRLPWAAGGLATAAVLVLAVTLVLDQASVTPADFEPAPVPPAAPPAMAPAEADAAGGAAGVEEPMPASPEQRLAPDAARELSSTANAARQGAAAEVAAEAISERVAATASRREAAGVARPAPVTYADPGCATPVEVPPGAALRPLPDGVEVSVDGDVFQLRCIDGSWARQEADGGQDR